MRVGFSGSCESATGVPGFLVLCTLSRLKPQKFLCWLSDYPRSKTTVSADGWILRGRPPSVLCRKNYHQHRMPTLGAFEGDVVPVRIARNLLPFFVEAMEVRDPWHFPVPPFSRALNRVLHSRQSRMWNGCLKFSVCPRPKTAQKVSPLTSAEENLRYPPQ